MKNLPMQVAEEFISKPRIGVYLQEVGGTDTALALELYQWAIELAGAFHATLSFVEISLRNSIDKQLKKWNKEQHSEEWTAYGQTRDEIKAIAGKSIKAASNHAKKEISNRSGTSQHEHPSHDDILAQLTFGNLTYLFIDPPGIDSTERKEIRDTIWLNCLKNAFPDTEKPLDKRICNLEDGRLRIGRSLEHLRQLRNRVAHHDNLLHIDIRREINTINSVLSKMHPDLPGFAMAKSQLRRLRAEDPRKGN